MPADPDPRDLASPDAACRQRAVEAAYRAHGTAVLGLAYNVMGDRHAAEDVLQQTFLAVLEHSGRYRGDGSVRGWILTIAANLTRRALVRRSTGRRALRALPRGASEPPADASTTTKEVHESITRAMQRLPAEQRLAATLSLVDGLPAREIATILGCPEGTVWSRVHHAKRRLGELLSDLGPERPQPDPKS